MSTSYRHFNVRLTRDQWDRVASMARSQNSSVAEVIRSAIDTALDAQLASNTSDRRQIRTAEFSHLVLDFIMRRQFPDFRDRLIAETDRCMELYHGA